jgi:chromate transporter
MFFSPLDAPHNHNARANAAAPMNKLLVEIFTAFLKLGLISFGGPVAHLSYFREEFVNRRRWLDDAVYADLVALCQFLPGPASTQMVFALGSRRAGFPGGILATLCFTAPSALVMILFAFQIGKIGDPGRAGWLNGLKVAAVAVVAQAVWGMAAKLCTDRIRAALAILAAIATLAWPGATGQVGVIVTGGIAGWIFYRHQAAGLKPVQHADVRGHFWAAGSLAVFFLLLFTLPVIVARTGSMAAAMFDGFYRSGSLVFGGGHVILPLLRVEVVPRGWISDDAFLAGYGAAQAIPGPLFTFAGYLGALMRPQPNGWTGAFWCLLAIFLPALLLIGGTLPFWERLRSFSAAQAALIGTNAAVVGILAAALYNPVWIEGIRGVPHFFLAVAAFAALAFWKFPPWLVVLFMAGAGALLL